MSHLLIRTANDFSLAHHLTVGFSTDEFSLLETYSCLVFLTLQCLRTLSAILVSVAFFLFALLFQASCMSRNLNRIIDVIFIIGKM